MSSPTTSGDSTRTIHDYLTERDEQETGRPADLVRANLVRIFRRLSLRSLVAVIAISVAAAGLFVYRSNSAGETRVVVSLEDEGAFIYSHCLRIADWDEDRYLLVAAMVIAEEEVLDIESIRFMTNETDVIDARTVLVPGTPFLTIDVDRLQDDRFEYSGSEEELRVEDLPAQHRSGLATVAMLLKIKRDGEFEPTRPALTVDELVYRTESETVVRKVDVQQWVSRTPIFDDACEEWKRSG